MSGYKVILTENGKKYGESYSGVLENSKNGASIRENLIKNQLNKIQRFANSQLQLQEKIEAILAESGLTLEEFLQQRSGFNQPTNDKDKKIMLFKNKYRKYSKDKDKKEKEIYLLRAQFEKTSQKYYNAIHKVIRLLTSAIDLKGTPEQIQAQLSTIQKQINELDDYEQELFNNYQTILTDSRSLQIMEEELLSEWEIAKTKSNEGVRVGNNGEIVTSPLTAEQEQELDDSITSLIKGAIQRRKEGGKTPLSFLNSKSATTKAGQLKQFFNNVEKQTKQLIKQTQGENYIEKEIQAASHKYLLEMIKRGVFSIDQPDKKTYSLSELAGFLHHSSKTGQAQSEAKIGEISHSGLAAKAFQKEVENFSFEVVQSGGQKTRNILTHAQLTTFYDENNEADKNKSEISINLQKIQNQLTDTYNKNQKEIEKAQKEINKQKMYETKITPVEDKIDNYIKMSDKRTGEKFFIAFSDKLLNSFSDNSNISEIETTSDTNLLNSLDLFSGPDFHMDEMGMNTNKLLFAMLNQSKASIYYNQETRKDIKNFIEDMLATYYVSLAFNAENFVKITEGATSSNVLYISNVNNAYAPASIMLKGIINQLKNKDTISEVIKAVVSFDDAHSSMNLWDASIRAVPEDVDARWNYVANQVAYNTNINVTANLLALNNLFTNTLF